MFNGYKNNFFKFDILVGQNNIWNAPNAKKVVLPAQTQLKTLSGIQAFVLKYSFP